MAPTATSTNGNGNGHSAPMSSSEVAGLSDEEIYSLASETFALRSRQDALLCLLGGELDRREAW